MSNNVTVKWTAVPGATSYKVYSGTSMIARYGNGSCDHCFGPLHRRRKQKPYCVMCKHASMPNVNNTMYQYLCVHCCKPLQAHAKDQCLFQPTKYEKPKQAVLRITGQNTELTLEGSTASRVYIMSMLEIIDLYNMLCKLPTPPKKAKKGYETEATQFKENKKEDPYDYSVRTTLGDVQRDVSRDLRSSCKHGRGSCETCGTSERTDRPHTTVGGQGRVAKALRRRR